MLPRSVGERKRWWVLSLLSLLMIGSEPSSQGPGGGPPIVALDDPRLAQLRAAAARWEARQGPARAVVDQVCLVPDLAGFFDAISRWDRTRYYPILIEDAESTLRFLRAFRPSRVIRPSRPSPSIKPAAIWAAACAATRQSWREPGQPPPAEALPSSTDARGVRPPVALDPTTPGVVLSHPGAPMLAAAVALSAGRCQALVRFEVAGDDHEPLDLAGFRQFDEDLARTVAAVVPDGRGLGDDCDFLTLAGRYPDRYSDARGEVEAVDDAVARTPAGARWAYAGRILGDPATSVYRAMCALFLKPDSITWFNGYDEATSPWANYSTRGAALRFSGAFSTVSRQTGNRSAAVADWHEAFGPENHSGLVWVNSHGSPTVFHLQDNETASTADVPRTVPCAVVMIHSFSAADPTDPATIAGRWLANGAFVYFGSLNEPFLQAFRTPQLAGDLLAQHLPMAAALRATAAEPFGGPWRLTYLGDPLYRIDRAAPVADPGQPEARSRRVVPLDVPDQCEVVRPDALDRLPAGAPSEAVVRAGFDAAILLASSSREAEGVPALSATLVRLSDLDRDALGPEAKRTYDLVLADLMFTARRRAELRFRIEAIPPGDRSPDLVRWLEALRTDHFAWVLAGSDFDRIAAAWLQVVRSDASVDFRRQATARAGVKADDPERRATWARVLREALGAGPARPGERFVAEELGRIEAATRADRPRAKPSP